MVNLNDAFIAKAKKEAKATNKRKDLSDGSQPGLLLRIGVTGTMTWTLACRDPDSHSRKFTLGSYPALGIKEARIRARKLREEIRDGKHSIAEKRREGGVSTLNQLLDAYGATDLPGKTWKRSVVRIRLVYKALLEVPLAELKLSDLLRAYDKYPFPADFAARTFRPVLKWGAKREYLSRELTLIESRQTSERDRHLNQDEAKAIISHLETSRSMYAKAMRFIIWTICRRGEATRARWKEIDFAVGTWTIPKAHIKDTRKGKVKGDHRLFLSKQALAFLVAHKPRNARPDDRVFPNENGNELGNWDRYTTTVHKKTGTKDWHRHDLRRTGATILSDMGVHKHVIDAALNHINILDPLGRRYIRSRYEKEAGEALQKLADFYEKLCNSALEVAA